MALVLLFIFGRILSGHMLNVFGSMSTNMGLILFNAKQLDEATNEYGEVITSPSRFSARTARSSACEPFATANAWLQLLICLSCSSNFLQ